MNTPATHRVSMLEAMLLIRAYEEALAARATPTSPGTCTSVGQEAAAVGVVRALEPRDRILTNHRSAGHLLARGADTGRLIAEVMGRVDGYCKGKSGTLHISVEGARRHPHLDHRRRRAVARARRRAVAEDGAGRAGAIAAVFFGDGAACEGIFHESINLAVDVAAAAAVRLREQPVAGLRGAARDDAGRPVGDAALAAAVRHPRPGATVSTATTSRRCHAAARAAAASIRDRRWAVLPRARHLSPARPLRARRPGLCRPGRAGALEAARPDRARRRAPARREA